MAEERAELLECNWLLLFSTAWILHWHAFIPASVTLCRYDFDIGSRVSNESEGSIEGVYNVNTEEDIDLSMFANSHHATATDSNLYVENPILPPEQLESDDSHEAVRLATFTTRPSPLGTPGGSPSLSKRNLFEFNELSSQDVVEPPVYAKVDFSAKARGNRSADTYEQLTVEGLV